MVQHTRTRDPDAGVRRFLEDLRSGFDRRSWAERRHGERRRGRADWNGTDRRSDDRRRGPVDRRRPPSGSYGPGDQDRIAEMLGDPTLAADCPRCGAPLLRTETLRTGRPVEVIQCTGCRRRAEMA